MEKEQQIQLKVSFSRKNSRSNIKETVNRNINNLNVSNITFNQISREANTPIIAKKDIAVVRADCLAQGAEGLS